MVHSLQQLSADEIQSLPLDRLGILVLKHLVETKEWNAYNFLNSGMNLNLPEPTLRCWSEALVLQCGVAWSSVPPAREAAMSY